MKLHQAAMAVIAATSQFSIADVPGVENSDHSTVGTSPAMRQAPSDTVELSPEPATADTIVQNLRLVEVAKSLELVLEERLQISFDRLFSGSKEIVSAH